MISENSYIKFISPEEKNIKDKGRDIKLDEIKGVEMEFNMDVTLICGITLITKGFLPKDKLNPTQIIEDIR